MDNPLYGYCFGVTKETFGNQKRRCPIDRLMKRICLLQEVYVSRGSFLKKLISEFSNAKNLIKIYDQYMK